MSEHQKRQEARRKDYEIIKVPYAHLKQAIINDETLEQVKVALRKFKAGKKMTAAGLRFNPALQRWLNIAEGRIARWERDNPKPESVPKTKPKKKTKKETKKADTETKPDGEPPAETEPPEGEPKELSATKEVTGSTADAETVKIVVEPKGEDENPDEEPKPDPE